jgi:hypothetical protein
MTAHLGLVSLESGLIGAERGIIRHFRVGAPDFNNAELQILENIELIVRPIHCGWMVIQEWPAKPARKPAAVQLQPSAFSLHPFPLTSSPGGGKGFR